MALNTSEQVGTLEGTQTVANLLVDIPLVLFVVALTMGIVFGLDKMYGYVDKRKAAARKIEPSYSSVITDEEEE